MLAEPPKPGKLTLRYTRPHLYAKQRDAIFSPERIAVIEASTKAGKTVGCIAWIIEQNLGGPRYGHHWWVAPVYEQAHIAYTRMKRGFRMPEDLRDSTKAPMRIVMPNGADFVFKSGKDADNLFGEDVHSCVIDEATRMKEDSWVALQTTMTATGGPVRIIGNVKGTHNWVYDLARRAEKGEPGMSYAKLTYHDAVDAGILDPAVIETARGNMSPGNFRELYEAEPGDFSGGTFRREWFKYFRVVEIDDRKVYDIDKGALGHHLYPADACSHFAIADCAVTAGGGDYTVIGMFARTPDGDLLWVRMLRNQMAGTDLIPTMKAIQPIWGFPWIGIESNGTQKIIAQLATQAGLAVSQLQPRAGKEDRAIPAALRMKEGMIAFNVDMADLEDMEDELLRFPDPDSHDDTVDVLSYAEQQTGAGRPAVRVMD